MRLVLALLAAPALFADAISFGIKGGIPLSDILSGTPPLTIATKPVTLGPVLNVRLPLGLGFETGALYKRFNQSTSSQSKSGDSWEFPLLGQFRIAAPLVEPYLEAGVSFNRLSGLIAVARDGTLDLSGQSGTRTGIAFGGGIAFKLPGVRITPGLRYTHWPSTDLVRSTNQADFLVGITF